MDGGAGRQKFMLFESVRYFVAPTTAAVSTGDNASSPSQKQDWQGWLEQGGATRVLSLQEATHHFADRLPPNEPTPSTPVAPPSLVSPQWVRDTRRVDRLVPVEAYDPRKPFCGHWFWLDDQQFSVQDCEMMVAAVEFLGGKVCTSWHDPLLTYRIALRPREEEAIETPPTPSNIRTLLPHYLDDCLTCRRRLPIDAYAFPDPPLFRQLDQSVVANHPHSRLSAGAVETLKLPPLPSLPFLQGSVIHLDPGYGMDPKRLQVYRQHLEAAGAQLVDEYDAERVHMVVVDTMQAPLYAKARADGKQIGTLYWILHCLQEGKLVDPGDHILRIPCPDHHNIEPFKSKRFCISNYVGLARIILKNMIVHLGGQYTAQLNSKVDLLICAETTGDKYLAARQWNINIVNHLWLEDVWNTGSFRAYTEQRYLVFGPALGMIVGQTKGVLPLEQVPLPASLEAVLSAPPPPTVPVKRPLLSADKAHAPPTKQPRRSDSRDSAFESTPGEATSRRSSQPQHHSTEIRVAFTGITPTTKHLQALRSLHLQQSSRVQDATHLVAKKISRTDKFLCGIGYCRHIVSEEWLLQSAEAQTLLEEADFQLVDVDSERIYGMCWLEVMKMGRRGTLLDGWTVAITPNVKPSRESIRNMVEAHGGKYLLLPISSRRIEHFVPSRTLVISCEDDRLLWDPWIAHQHTIYRTETLVRSVLRQEITLTETLHPRTNSHGTKEKPRVPK